MFYTSIRRFLLSCATLTAVACLGIGGWAPPVHASLDVPQLLSFQGRLTDASRITVDDASYNMKFSIYTASSGGSCLWTAAGSCGTPTAVSVSVTDGVFSVLLGDSGQNALDDTLFDDYSALYLGITIGSDSEMTPRKRIVASAFALQAGDSDLLDSLNTDNDGCTSACVPVTGSGGNLIVTGTAGATAATAPLYVNPSTSVDANDILFGVASSGANRFTVDEDGDAVFGNNNSTDTTLTLYNSNNTYGSITGSRYSSYDSIQMNQVLNSAYGSVFAYNGLQIAASPNTATPLYINETDYDGAADAAGTRDDAGLFINTSSSMYTSTGSYGASGIKGRVAYTGTGQNSSFYGTDMRATSSPTGTLASAYGTYSSLTHTTAQTLTNGYGVYGFVRGTSGTITNAVGVHGSSAADGGTVTNAYGGLFKASGGSKNYAVYTAEGLVQIDGDASVNSPTTSTADGELFVVGDIESDANLDIAGFAGIGTTPTSTEALKVDKTYNGFSSATRTGAYTRAIGTGANGASSMLIAQDMVATISASGGSDMAESLMGGRAVVTHAGAGTVTTARGVTGTVDVSSSGTVTSANGLEGRVNVSSASGTITTGIGVNASVTNSGGGTLTQSIGLYGNATGGTTNISLYAGDGYVHIEGDTTRTTPTLSGVGTSGSLFVRNNVEIYSGSLCVGNGSTDDCSGITPTAGELYATNASVNAHDLAEMFPSTQFLLAGEIISADPQGDEHVHRSSGKEVILGAVSTTPGLTLGWGGENEYPIALTGRTPIKVNGEGGAIAIGDRIGLSSVAGIGKKAVGAGEVVGVAMQAFNGSGEGAVMTFVSPEYWDGQNTTTLTSSEITPVVAPLSDNGVLAVRENHIANVATLRGYNWSISEVGTFTTKGEYVVAIRGHQGNEVDTQAVLAVESIITLVGSTTMQGDMVTIDFEKVSPSFNDVISAIKTPMIVATVSEGGGAVSITRKDQNGFTLQRESGNPTRVDWVAYSYRKDHEPEEMTTSGVVVSEEESVPTVVGDAEEPVPTTTIQDTVVTLTELEGVTTPITPTEEENVALSSKSEEITAPIVLETENTTEKKSEENIETNSVTDTVSHEAESGEVGDIAIE